MKLDAAVYEFVGGPFDGDVTGVAEDDIAFHVRLEQHGGTYVPGVLVIRGEIFDHILEWYPDAQPDLADPSVDFPPPGMP